MSRYDQIHDAHIPDSAVKKQGTKYERLTAVVAQILNNEPTTHDVRLLGDSEIKHQIDVTVGKRRVVIECKDLDESSSKVGLDTVKSFATVVRDLHPDEGWIVTPIGFARDAMKLAKHVGLKLLILRRFEDEDWKGRLRRIGFDLNIKLDFQHRMGFVAGATGASELAAALQMFGSGVPVVGGKTGVILTIPGRREVDAAEWLQEQRNGFDVLHQDDGEHRKEFPVPNATVTLGEFGTHPISGISVNYIINTVTEQIVVDTGNRIATLLVQGLGDSDLVIWDQDLQRFHIDVNGDVIER